MHVFSCYEEQGALSNWNNDIHTANTSHNDVMITNDDIKLKESWVLEIIPKPWMIKKCKKLISESVNQTKCNKEGFFQKFQWEALHFEPKYRGVVEGPIIGWWGGRKARGYWQIHGGSNGETREHGQWSQWGLGQYIASLAPCWGRKWGCSSRRNHGGSIKIPFLCFYDMKICKNSMGLLEGV